MSCCVQEEKILFLQLLVRNENCQESTMTYTEKASLSEEQETPNCQISGFRRSVDEVFAVCIVKQCILVAAYRRLGKAYRSQFQVQTTTRKNSCRTV